MLVSLSSKPALGTLRRNWSARNSLPAKPSLVTVPVCVATVSRCLTTGSTRKERPSYTDLDEYTPDTIRNFSIIAHVDHGKSTLADRLLEATGTIVGDGNANSQILDTLPVERQRGITVKANSSTMLYTEPTGRKYMLNLIDTPGHVDFSFEVERSLSACQGAVLIVDASKGVQAQTLANYRLATQRFDLAIVPVVNKIDIKSANVEVCVKQVGELCGVDDDKVLRVSSKLGVGVDTVLSSIVSSIPPPAGSREAPLVCLIHDSWYLQHRGAVASIAVIHGSIATGDTVTIASTGAKEKVRDCGVFHPLELVSTGCLRAGQTGWMVAGARQFHRYTVGETVYGGGEGVPPTQGTQRPVHTQRPVLYAGLHPMEPSGYLELKKAVDQLALNDPSVTIDDSKTAVFGQGFRLGFVGPLHMEVFVQRLEDEHAADVIVTGATVPYKATLVTKRAVKHNRGETSLEIYDPSVFPAKGDAEILEPVVMATIVTPSVYLDEVMQLCDDCRGHVDRDVTELGNDTTSIKLILPLNEIISTGLFERLKSLSSGCASFDYSPSGFERSDIVKVELNLNKVPCDQLSLICHATRVRAVSRALCLKLKELLPQQIVQVDIQAVVYGRVVARETKRPYKKDVTAKIKSGGDKLRKMKLIREQIAGKKKLKSINKVMVPKEVFAMVLQIGKQT